MAKKTGPIMTAISKLGDAVGIHMDTPKKTAKKKKAAAPKKAAKKKSAPKKKAAKKKK